VSTVPAQDRFAPDKVSDPSIPKGKKGVSLHQTKYSILLIYFILFHYSIYLFLFESAAQCELVKLYAI